MKIEQMTMITLEGYLACMVLIDGYNYMAINLN